MAQSDPWLIAGADGTIGAALAQRLQARDLRLLLTTRRPDSGAGRLHLDLADIAPWRPPEPVEVAFICAGVAAVQKCAQAPEHTRPVNVTATIELARRLAQDGARVVYLSTNQVFDGTRGQRRADEPASPVTEYGRQKAEAERGVLALGEMGCVVRLTKVLAPLPPLLVQWRDALRAGQAVQPFEDMRMAPVPLAFVAEVLEEVGRRGVAGIVQVSAEMDVTYAEVARHLAWRLGADPQLVQPRSVTSAGIAPGGNPAHTTLDTSRLHEELGLTPPHVWRTIEQAVEL